MEIKIKTKSAAKIRKGYPLIERAAVENQKVNLKEGDLFHAVDEKGQFLGQAYYGIQNKGIAWIISRERNEQIDETFFRDRFEKAFSRRKSLFKAKETTAFRLFNGEGDGIGGITIDYFDGHYLIHWYSKGIYTFRDIVIQALRSTANCKSIYQKKRFDDKGQYMEDDDFVLGEKPEFPLIVKENGVHFAVYLNDGAMTGIFLDQREVRNAIRDKYAGGEMLNMFSYTGAFSVNAALAGSVTTSVDVAKRSRAKTIEQFSLNGIDYEEQQIVIDDVFQYFKYAARKAKQFDLIVLDPPSFAKTKKRTFSAAKDYTELMKETIAITRHKGVIVASTNSSAFDRRRFKLFLDEACKQSKVTYQVLEEFSLPEDFRTISGYPEGDYLKVVVMRIQK